MGDAMEIKNRDSFVVGSGQVSVGLEGETVILSLRDGLYYGLDEIGTRIWDLIQQPITLDELRAILLDEFEVEPEVCVQEVTALLEELKGKGVVEIEHEATP